MMMKTHACKMQNRKGMARQLLSAAVLPLMLLGCAQANVPGARDLDIPAPAFAEERKEAINERPDSVMYLPLGRDVLIPEISMDDPLPSDMVGPLELRGETLAGALQLILADYDVPLAFESNEGLTRTITVANLRGPLNSVVHKVCGLAQLYCSFEDGVLVVKENQTFTVKIPPISQDESFMQNVAAGLAAIVGTSPIIDSSTRTLVYTANQTSADMALRYFQRMRASTALIVFETYIWEVSLNAGNATGIRWDMLADLGKFGTGFSINDATLGEGFTNPISIGLPTTKGIEGADGSLSAREIFNFLSQFGAVKTVSQPQITVLSGSEARLRAAERQNYVAEISETLDNGQSTTSVSTDSVDTGFTLTVGSAWDNATVYADIEIALTDVLEIEDFAFDSTGGGSTTIQLPRTTERELNTQVRVRPGDSVLIAGLVQESDNFNTNGLGLMEPIVPTNRSTVTTNQELVFLLRPRVVVYTNPEEGQRNAIRGSAMPAPSDAPVNPDVPSPGQTPFVAPAPVATSTGGEAFVSPVTESNVAPIAPVVPAASAAMDSSVEVAPLDTQRPATLARDARMTGTSNNGAPVDLLESGRLTGTY
ncbi:type II secretion system protein GspD [Micavibrio aeruginosavorus]|uniref:Type II and III secretion system protein n=1 Tax=Micavibrio aeruginosavorus EPB TaxID=349215 RepID=M4VJI4_9BACT|nr:type II and III secretion system protein [Micavibrio aeruginosavorus]AGH98650.1 type II and III secretion system protein [Micavibrio aeruginosavorus EPB]